MVFFPLFLFTVGAGFFLFIFAFKFFTAFKEAEEAARTGVI